MIWLLLAGCGGPPETADSARAPIADQLQKRYGEAFELVTVDRRPNGLAGTEAHFFTFRAKDASDREFEGSVDFDTEPLTFIDHYPCARDQHATDAALDAVLEIEKSRVLQRSVSCSPALAEANPTQHAAGLSWMVSVAVFDRADLDTTRGIHEQIQNAAKAAGVPNVDTRIHAYSTGWSTVNAFRDTPLSPTIEQLSLGMSKSKATGDVSMHPTVRSSAIAEALRGQVSEPPGTLWVTVEAKPGTSVEKKLTDAALADLSDEEQRDLRVTLQLAVSGTVSEHGDDVRSWVERTYQTFPKALTPAIYIGFYTPAEDGGWAPERQSKVWVANRGMGHRIRKSGLGRSQLIEAFKYVVPPEGVP